MGVGLADCQATPNAVRGARDWSRYATLIALFRCCSRMGRCRSNTGQGFACTRQSSGFRSFGESGSRWSLVGRRGSPLGSPPAAALELFVGRRVFRRLDARASHVGVQAKTRPACPARIGASSPTRGVPAQPAGPLARCGRCCSPAPSSFPSAYHATNPPAASVPITAPFQHGSRWRRRTRHTSRSASSNRENLVRRGSVVDDSPASRPCNSLP